MSVESSGEDSWDDDSERHAVESERGGDEWSSEKSSDDDSEMRDEDSEMRDEDSESSIEGKSDQL